MQFSIFNIQNMNERDCGSSLWVFLFGAPVFSLEFVQAWWYTPQHCSRQSAISLFAFKFSVCSVYSRLQSEDNREWMT